MIPYWSLYLKSLDFSAETIGLLMATLHLSRIFSPALWGWIADRTGHRIRIIRIGALLTWVVFIAVFWQTSALGIGLVMLGYSFFWNAVLPQFEVVTLNYLGSQQEKYSQIRLWGSVGFIIAVLLLGYALDSISVDWIPIILFVLMILIWVNSLLIPSVRVSVIAEEVEVVSFKQLMLTPQVVAFFVITLLIQFSHGPYYTFFSLMMQKLEYTRSQIGMLWSLGVVAEVAIFVVMHSLIARLGLRLIMIISLFLCIVRWSLLALWPEKLLLVIVAQILHAATFGSLHAVGITLVHYYFPDSMKGRGQAIFSSIGFGLGGTLGAIVAGLLWESQGAAVAFGVAALASVVAIMLAYVWIHPEKVQQNSR
ncbi:MFS transporter, PPP family, 3-phenylpropionic acid transporter [Neptunomonas antarctica]|uniref:MFS transporter, PPP family, 3-phenylpropionic acid transporter n=2 Tax=Neptunomonas antarctica TaxID=619304 RepID=A0A1N7JYE0_9GAMM|nr:MFS transporter, PPP family, 3-phenylpropionic acid transporter [Neptunomonas antarctica]